VCRILEHAAQEAATRQPQVDLLVAAVLNLQEALKLERRLVLRVANERLVALQPHQ
jgi:hypothetical protein